MDITEVLESVDKDILNDETLKQISENFDLVVEAKVDERVKLAVESALIEQDEKHADKLKQMVNMIDEDHTKKLETVIEQVEDKYKDRLDSIVERYEAELSKNAQKHINRLTEDLDRFLDQYVEELVPTKLVQEAARNTYATRVLNEAKEILSVDERFANKKFKSAVKDGYSRIETLTEELNRKNREIDGIKAKTYLENRLSSMPTAKANFIKKRLDGKPLSFIKEQFKFVEGLYSERDASPLITPNQKPSIDRQVNYSVISESIEVEDDSIESSDPIINFYMQGLNERK